MLSPTEIDHYREQDYVHLRSLFDRERLARWQRRFEELRARRDCGAVGSQPRLR